MRNSAYGISKIKCQNMETVKDNKIKASHLYEKKTYLHVILLQAREVNEESCLKAI